MNEQERTLVERYFRNSERTITLSAGSKVIQQDGYNDRLYYVHSGELVGDFEEYEGRHVKVFAASKGAFIGVHSFFSGTWTASSTVVAQTEVKLSWIDRHCEAVEVEKFGPLSTQFMPVIVAELNRRQRRAHKEAVEKEKALEKLHSAEQMTTLAQLAAGISHELNNAIGVVSSKSERLESLFMELLEEVHPEASQFFDYGLMHGQKVSSSEARRRGLILERKYQLPKNVARELARAVPEDELSSHWISNANLAIRYWQMGRDLHDLRVASSHTVGIVKSVKQLARSEVNLNEELDINDTINRALTLLQSDLRRVSVRMRPGNLPKLKGSQTEWVQVWVNIVKNACDAMMVTPEPRLDIQTKYSKHRLLVTLTNNGPEIDEATRRKIFQPSFTTKKDGLSFGLGLGLSIVKRIVSSYGGSIAVKSDQDATIFRIKLPVEDDHGET
ncbi:ATP-binding protein [Vibrio diazotrophicus]|uniref:histidine kinase n=1 Tax=Vibrio diazotrophicus TaxID=685 RepID=A0ABX4WET3_VIBDI|nr:ATP-binding protein [Vibrio diazotrophicus]MCZ4371259.1 ATP-binding protein [Vibrio diazotrophicus]PNI01462.1 histidine kinase [Vibrio diazotrophicus]